jgi:hypothetical protein
MYPRLYLARNLLRDDGVIFVSIDDNEIHNLRLIMNEVFGEENFVAQITVLCNPKGRSQDKYFATNHEYILVYSKTLLPKGSFSLEKDEEQIEAEYPEQDENGEKYRLLELRNTHREFGKHNRANLFYPIYVNPESGDLSLSASDNFVKVLPIWDDGYEGCWTWDKAKATKDFDFLEAKKNGQWKIYRRSYANGAEKMLKTIFNDKLFYTEKGQKTFSDLFATKDKLFPSPKSVDLLKQLVRTSTQSNDIVLDFFAGSSTLAHAVFAQNMEDNNARRFLCVQLAEKTTEDSIPFKAGYSNIAEIAKDRIRKSSEKIKADRLKQAELFPGEPPDLGLKVFKLRESNFRTWRGDLAETEAELAEQLDMFVDTLRPEAQEENVAYELMLKSGFELTTSLKRQTQGGTSYWSINGGEVLLLLSSVDEDLIGAVVASRPHKVICLDSLFHGDDQLKTNTALAMKDAGIPFEVV